MATTASIPIPQRRLGHRNRMATTRALLLKPRGNNSYFFLTSESKPSGGFKSARIMATAWARDLSAKKRTGTARLFIAEAIEAFADSFTKRYGLQTAMQTPRPYQLLPGALDRTAGRLAVTLGEEVAALDPVAAAYWLSTTYTAMLPDEMRSRLGIYYTPPALSKRLIDMAEEAGVDWTTAKILDPACGGGAFLAPLASRMLMALADLPPAEILASISARLRGFEIDPFAAWMSQVFLEITLSKLCVSARQQLSQLVTICDSLEQKPDGGFDLVIGNPPYGRTKLRPELRERYKRSLFGHANLYGVFTDLALRWTAQGGVVAYVTPTSFLAGEYFKRLRSLLRSEAPPVAVDFIADRKDVFESVLQETMLATYRKDGKVSSAAVHHLAITANVATMTHTGTFCLPVEPSMPWLLPRQPENMALVTQLSRMKTRLADWGYTISTGQLVWNRHKNQLRSRPSKGSVPLIWAEVIAGPGHFIYRAEKRNHQPFFKLEPGDKWLTTDKPCVLIQRTTAKEQSRRLIAAALPEDLIEQYGQVVVENHLNMVRPLNGKPKVSAAVVAAVLNSTIVDQAFRCISGSVAVSAFELEALPLPPLERVKEIETLVRRQADTHQIEQMLQAIYLGEVI